MRVPWRILSFSGLGSLSVLFFSGIADPAPECSRNQIQSASTEEAAKSPWGPSDEIGRLNLMTQASRAEILGRIKSGVVFDLGVKYSVGMPSFVEHGDPPYQYWLTHTPRGSIVDNIGGIGKKRGALLTYTGDAFSMYTHTGTHIDSLCHFGLNGEIWNRFAADEFLGDQGWKRAGAEKLPPIIARGVLIDVPRSLKLEMLPPNFRIGVKEIDDALRAQSLSIRKGDVVLIRTGRMKLFASNEAYGLNSPGLGIEAAKHLAKLGAMVIGIDNLHLEVPPPDGALNPAPVHTFLLAQAGIPVIEVVNLEELSSARVYEFAFIAASLKLQGASGSPMRPIAMPVFQE